jgi:hypothetical protein
VTGQLYGGNGLVPQAPYLHEINDPGLTVTASKQVYTQERYIEGHRLIEVPRSNLSDQAFVMNSIQLLKAVAYLIPWGWSCVCKGFGRVHHAC